MKILNIFLVSSFFLLFSCSEKGGNSSQEQQDEISSSVFSDAISEFRIQVYYEAGAAPYVGNIGLTADQTWDVTDESYKALFLSHSSRSIVVPKALADMSEIADQGKANWSSQALIQLGRSLSPTLIDNDTVIIPVIFLNGLFEGKSNVLGIHITGSHFAFIFKDVVTGVGGDSTTQRYVEQATVVHEVGHAVGLVNNGIPLSTAHEDTSHPKHTLNEDCVMYWAVESTTDILTFLTSIIAGGEVNLFETESLQDGRDYHP